MNILVAVNEEYLEPLRVMLFSLSVHNRLPIKVYILHFHIPEEAQMRFGIRVQKYNMEVYFQKVDEAQFAGIAKSERYRLEANLRLAMLNVLPQDMERIMWLDTDILVKGNLERFYNYPNKGQYAVVCEDMFTNSEKNDLLQKLDMKCARNYFNSGVMLFYLDNLRKDFANDAFTAWARNNPDKLKYPDQNVLNVCLQGNVTWANPLKYNLQLLRIHEQVHTRMKSAKIIHYNMPTKPWKDDFIGDGEFLFWKYAVCVWGIGKFIKHYVKKIIGKEG